MAIVGDKPESGVRLELERAREEGPPWTYEGHAVTPEGRHAMRAVVTADGDVQVSGVAADLETKAKLIVRAAYKHAHDEGSPPPRRIVRWRGEK